MKKELYARGETFDSGKELISDPELQTSRPLLRPADTVLLLHDVDHEYLSQRCLLRVPVDINTHNDKTPSERLSKLSYFLTRSPSQLSPPTLAPPIIDSDMSSHLH